ncbi:hypothetical protein ACGFZP_21980 [Kitasatospora sp. NPDC048239]|uniref:hypothetical protein n=1 Tax=Kitasatospora sp. NPDC048239 TaxID=3364046 RepID=UPI00371576AB
MDRKTYTAELTELRELRTEITAAEKQVAAAQKELDKLAARRARRVAGLAGNLDRPAHQRRHRCPRHLVPGSAARRSISR